MKAVINYGIEVQSEFLQTEIPNNLWKVPTTWWEGLPCYLSLDGTKAIVRICNPVRVNNDKGACSWDNVPTISTTSTIDGEEVSTTTAGMINKLDEEVDIIAELKVHFGDLIMSLEEMNEKLQSSEYYNQNIDIEI